MINTVLQYSTVHHIVSCTVIKNFYVIFEYVPLDLVSLLLLRHGSAHSPSDTGSAPELSRFPLAALISANRPTRRGVSNAFLSVSIESERPLCSNTKSSRS